MDNNYYSVLEPEKHIMISFKNEEVVGIEWGEDFIDKSNPQRLESIITYLRKTIIFLQEYEIKNSCN